MPGSATNSTNLPWELTADRQADSISSELVITAHQGNADIGGDSGCRTAHPR